MTRTELNEAIFTVITATYKKDAPEAFKAVNEAGYSIEKWNGCWHVRNEKLNRMVWFEMGGYYTPVYWVRGSANPKRFETLDGARKFDLVGCLEKENNPDWRYVTTYEYTPSRVKYNKLQSAKRNVGWKTRDIAKLKIEIEKMQKELNRMMEWRAESIVELKELRNELGLRNR